MKKALLSWSGGKECAMALHEILESDEHDVDALLTTITGDYDRVSMHGVRRVLIERQAESLGLDLEQVLIPRDTSNEEYEARMLEVLVKRMESGVEAVIFGDVFLEDVREYREDNLAGLGMEAVFPLWKRDTSELAREFIGLGFEATITCVDTEHLDGSFAGRLYDLRFLEGLPAGVDPCGENGEFHSFVSNGPIFKRAISYTVGETVLRDDHFYYCDLVPA